MIVRVGRVSVRHHVAFLLRLFSNMHGHVTIFLLDEVERSLGFDLIGILLSWSYVFLIDPQRVWMGGLCNSEESQAKGFHFNGL